MTQTLTCLIEPTTFHGQGRHTSLSLWHHCAKTFCFSAFSPCSYLFHLSFASSFTFLLNSTRLLLTGSRDNDAPTGSWWRELTSMALTGLLTMAVAVVFQIMPFYNILHDHYDIHTEVCVMLVIGLYTIIVWTGDRNKANTGKQGTRISYSLSCHLFQSDLLSLCLSQGHHFSQDTSMCFPWWSCSAIL